MKCIEVKTDPPYQIWIGPALIGEIGKLIAPIVEDHSVVILSDMYVDPLYGDAVCTAIEDFGIEVKSIPFMVDEGSKNLELVESLLRMLAQQSISRNDVILALGGGLIADVVTLTAALYLRGVKVIHVPTTLVAMLDAAIGGNADINIPEGKSMAGVCHDPSLVVADLDLLASLPDQEIKNGIGEIIKYAVIEKSDLYAKLKNHVGRTDMNDLEYIIGKCAEIKVGILAENPKSSQRGVLDLGLLVGQAIEIATDNAIDHGEALGLGMLVMAYGTGNSKTGDKIRVLLDKYGLMTTLDWPEREIVTAAMFKTSPTSRYTAVIPEDIGQCVVKRVTSRELMLIIRKGLSAIRPKKGSIKVGRRLHLLRRAKS